MLTRRLSAAGVLIGVLAVLSSPPARAQWNRPQVGTFMLGVYLPQDETMQRNWGEVWPSFQ